MISFRRREAGKQIATTFFLVLTITENDIDTHLVIGAVAQQGLHSPSLPGRPCAPALVVLFAGKSHAVLVYSRAGDPLEESDGD